MSAGPKLHTAAGKVKSFGTLFDAPNSVGSDNTLLMLQGDFSVSPPVGSLSLASTAPLVGAHVVMVPSGSLVVTTNTSYSDKVDWVALSLTGAPPTVSVGAGANTISPGAGSVSAAGSAPTLGTSQAASGAALALSGSTPTLIAGKVIAPSAAAITVAGSASILGTSEAPSTAGLTMGGNAPSLVRATIIQPSSGALVVGSSAPQQSAGLAPGTGGLGLGGSAPSLNGQQTITPAVVALSATGAAPSMLLARTITPNSGALGTAGNASASSQGQIETAGQANLSITGSAPVLGISIAPSVAVMTAGTSAPSLVLARIGQPGNVALSASGFAPSVLATNDFLARAGAGQVGAAGYAPAISRSSTSRGVAGLARGGDGSAAPFAEFYHAAGEVLRYGIDWTYWLARLWPSASQVAPGLVVRPSVSNGYQYVCAAGGITQSVEPVWPAMPGASLLDGSVLWTSAPIDTASLTASVASVVWSTAGLLVLSGTSIFGQVALVLIDTTRAISGNDYDVVCTATMTNGPPMIGKLRIKVR